MLIKRSVSVLILREDLKVLGVSRKDDLLAFGLPGGKVDPQDKNLCHAANRELREETGVKVWDANSKNMPLVYSGYCPGGSDGIAYLNHTFIPLRPDFTEMAQQKGEGRVAWIPIAFLLAGPFKQYNGELMRKIGILSELIDWDFPLDIKMIDDV
jgi:8-oxo-dGTP pyrophosphatase MutT (NUDIX family)